MEVKKRADLKNFIVTVGGTLKKETNEYEVARFIFKGETGIIYEGKKGISFNKPIAKQVYFNFENKIFAHLGEKKKRQVKYKAEKEALLLKNGKKCFYTLEEMSDDEISLEHLIPLGKGGTNNIDNMVLCKRSVNMDLGNKDILEKFKVREANIIKGYSLFELIKMKYFGG